MRIMIIGENAKEQSLAFVLERMGDNEVLVVPGNPGTRQFEQSVEKLPDGYNPENIPESVEKFDPELILICDEHYALKGLKEKLEKGGHLVFAPSTQAADFICSKKKWGTFLQKAGAPVTDFVIFDNYSDASSYVQENSVPAVFRELSGKERFAIPYTDDEAMEVLDEWFADGPTEVMISDYYDGTRFNLPVLVWEDAIVPLKSMIVERGIYEQEDDAQAKGMGAYCPLEDVLPKEASRTALEEVIRPVVQEMKKEGIPYTGFLSGEFVMSDDGPICVNLKPGLSEAGITSVFPLIRSDFTGTILSLIQGKETEIAWEPKASVSIVLAASNYPREDSYGHPVFLNRETEGFVTLNHVKRENGQLVTDGGRILIVTASGKTLSEAADNAMKGANQIQCDDLMYRTDIGRIE